MSPARGGQWGEYPARMHPGVLYANSWRARLRRGGSGWRHLLYCPSTFRLLCIYIYALIPLLSLSLGVRICPPSRSDARTLYYTIYYPTQAKCTRRRSFYPPGVAAAAAAAAVCCNSLRSPCVLLPFPRAHHPWRRTHQTNHLLPRHQGKSGKSSIVECCVLGANLAAAAARDLT